MKDAALIWKILVAVGAGILIILALFLALIWSDDIGNEPNNN
jgi:hypothetical protein